MLSWKKMPDSIFTKILNDAFAPGMCDYEILKDEDYFQYCYPNASDFFTPDETIEMIEQLDFYIKSPGVFSLNDYHLLLIYDVLCLYCETHNDLAVECDEPIIKGTKIFVLDFDRLVEEYLPETEICLCCLGKAGKPSMEELENKLLAENEHLFWNDKNDALLFNPESFRYPYFEVPEDGDEV